MVTGIYAPKGIRIKKETMESSAITLSVCPQTELSMITAGLNRYRLPAKQDIYLFLYSFYQVV